MPKGLRRSFLTLSEVWEREISEGLRMLPLEKKRRFEASKPTKLMKAGIVLTSGFSWLVNRVARFQHVLENDIEHRNFELFVYKTHACLQDPFTLNPDWVSCEDTVLIS